MKRILTIIVAITALFTLGSCKKNPLVGQKAPLDGTYWEGTYGLDDRHWDYKLKFNGERDCELRVIYYTFFDHKEHKLESDVTFSGSYELNGSQGTMHLRRNVDPYDDCDARFSWSGSDLNLEFDDKSIEMRR